jgi:hypothetical protein
MLDALAIVMIIAFFVGTAAFVAGGAKIVRDGSGPDPVDDVATREPDAPAPPLVDPSTTDTSEAPRDDRH